MTLLLSVLTPLYCAIISICFSRLYKINELEGRGVWPFGFSRLELDLVGEEPGADSTAELGIWKSVGENKTSLKFVSRCKNGLPFGEERLASCAGNVIFSDSFL